MATVPRIEAREGLRGIPVVTTDPRSVRNIGRDIAEATEDVGDALALIGQRRAERQAMRADIQFNDEIGALIHNPETGFLAMQGEQVSDAAGPVIEQARLARERILGELDGLARTAFDISSANTMTRTQSAVDRRVIDVERGLNIETRRARAANQLEVAARNHTDLVYVADALVAGLQATGDAAELQGLTPELTEESLREYRSAFHTAIVQAKLESSPFAARRYFLDHKDEIDAKETAALEPKVKLATDEQAAQLLSDSKFDPDKTETEMGDEIRAAEDDPSIRQKALRNISIRKAAQTRSEAADERELVEAEYQNFVRSKSPPNRPYTIADIPIDFPVQARRMLESDIVNHEKGVVEFNQAQKFGELLNMEAKDPQAFLEENVVRWHAVLSAEQLRTISTRQRQLRTATTFEPDPFFTIQAKFKQRLREEMGIDKQDKIDDAGVLFHTMYVAEQERLGRTLNDDDETKLLDRAFKEITTDVDRGLRFDDQIRLFQLTPETEIGPEVPGEEESRIRRYLASKTPPEEPTPQRIVELYRQILLNRRAGETTLR